MGLTILPHLHIPVTNIPEYPPGIVYLLIFIHIIPGMPLVIYIFSNFCLTGQQVKE